jgi:hypothetical protein
MTSPSKPDGRTRGWGACRRPQAAVRRGGLRARRRSHRPGGRAGLPLALQHSGAGPRRNGTHGDVHTTGFLLAAAAAALVAAALVHLLLLSTPSRLPFRWMVGLVTTLAVVYPFSTPLSAKVATALVGLVLGIVIGSLVGTVASRSVVRVTGPG